MPHCPAALFVPREINDSINLHQNELLGTRQEIWAIRMVKYAIFIVIMGIPMVILMIPYYFAQIVRDILIGTDSWVHFALER